MRTFHRNDEVAVMPSARSPMDVIRIAHLASVSRAFILTSDASPYAASDGQTLCRRGEGHIIPSTDEHRAVIMAKYHWSNRRHRALLVSLKSTNNNALDDCLPWTRPLSSAMEFKPTDALVRRVRRNVKQSAGTNLLLHANPIIDA